MFSELTLGQQFSLQKKKDFKKVVFTKMFIGNNCSLKETYNIYFAASIVFLSSRRVEWTIIRLWKVILKIWPQVDLTGKGHTAYQSIWIVELNTYEVLYRSNKNLSQKILQQNWWEPLMTWDALRDIKRGHWKIDLTLGHRYHNSMIYNLYMT